MEEDGRIRIRFLHQHEVYERSQVTTSSRLLKLWSSGSATYFHTDPQWADNLQHYPPCNDRLLLHIPFELSHFCSVPLTDDMLPAVGLSLRRLPWFSVPNVSAETYRTAMDSEVEQVRAEKQAMEQQVADITQQRDEEQKCRQSEAQTAQRLREVLERQNKEVDAVIGRWQAAEEREQSAIRKQTEIRERLDETVRELAQVPRESSQHQAKRQKVEQQLVELREKVDTREEELKEAAKEKRDNNAKLRRVESQVERLQQQAAKDKQARSAAKQAAAKVIDKMARQAKHTKLQRRRQTKQASVSREKTEKQLREERFNVEKQLSAERNHVETQREKLECKVCMEREVSVLLLPCNHLSLCSACATQMALKQHGKSWRLQPSGTVCCPICRQHAESGETVIVA